MERCVVLGQYLFSPSLAKTRRATELSSRMMEELRLFMQWLDSEQSRDIKEGTLNSFVSSSMRARMHGRNELLATAHA
jgi:hypothetical protein